MPAGIWGRCLARPRALGVGAELAEPVRGTWTLPVLPERVQVGDVVLRRSRWWDGAGVVAQYREETARDSAHMKLLESGDWVIDHRDAFNPDAGPLHAVGHFLTDMQPRSGLLMALLAVAAAATSR